MAAPFDQVLYQRYIELRYSPEQARKLVESFQQIKAEVEAKYDPKPERLEQPVQPGVNPWRL